MTVDINPQTIKKLREKTGAGMMTCKQALTENNGNFDKAVEFLKLKGIATANKKASRNTQEGIIYSYIHTGNKLGILLEINCETDFVARRPEFNELAKNIAMQIASNDNIEVISLDSISESMKNEVWQFENNKEDLINKPEEIRNKIISGRVEKALKTKVLLEQPFVRDSNITVEQYIKQIIAILGENIKVRRFVRYTLG
jgi:translation elongation factor Ts (EF-Ts)